MGSLFSSESHQQESARQQQVSFDSWQFMLQEQHLQQQREQQRLQQQREQQRLLQQREERQRLQRILEQKVQRDAELLFESFGNLTIHESEFFKATKLEACKSLATEILKSIHYVDEHSFADAVYQTEILDEYDRDYRRIHQLFRSTNKKCFVIERIEKIINPQLLAQFELTKIEYSNQYGDYEERQLFHGTRIDNVPQICRDNFNWRLRGSARGHIFGQGVSFTPISNYATNYGDKGYKKMMFLANVLVGESCVGSKDMIIPIQGTDTSIKPDGHVVVKYDDHTFYPSYAIYYRGIDNSVKNKHFF